MIVVADSGPLIHLSIIGQFFLLKEYLNNVLIIPQVYEEVVTQGKGRPGDSELRQAIKDGWVKVESVTDLALVQGLTSDNISETDAAVVACALEKKANIVLADDSGVRELTESEGLSVIGSVGILVYARQNGLIKNLKTLLHDLVTAGFHLDPNGQVYQSALKRVGELK
ncbi:MAG: hypothetical protein SCARUB_05058 [Candidatus Scalindua rubra]|uniref:DUF3368 domain-containing protein n=1 Tax=Candidatus Scalindua rubra TaxID=1872076 RepID=A0A1E3X2H9_9BACT|nr:MAG: hypothetical protein SCARUB_05058 [Candidatus Scalindua rubra]